MADIGSALSGSVSSLSSGNYIGAATSLLSGLIKLTGGHSDWYKCDQAYQTKDYKTAGAYILAFYNRGGVNDADFKGGIDGDVVPQYKGVNVPRYHEIPDIVNSTQDAQLLKIWQQLYSLGLLTDAPTTAAAAAATPNILTGLLAGAKTATGTTNNTVIYVILATVGAGIVTLVVFLFKGKRRR